MATQLRDLLRVTPGGTAELAGRDPDDTPGFQGKKAKARTELDAMAPVLADLQERLFAASTSGDRHRVLLVLQGMDTAGKGGTVKHVIGHLNPAGCRIRAFKAPTPQELGHHFLWRISNGLPRAGEVGIFDRSHYEDVLAVRVHHLVDKDVWSRRYAEINAWEEALTRDGLVLVKVFLHIGRDEQRDRLLRRLDRTDKHWKFSRNDLTERGLWPHYRKAYEAALERCSTRAAPWYVVPANRRWYRNWAVSRLLLEHLREIDPRFPPGDFDVEEARRRLLAE
ncbi:Polyphosphate:AMP_ADP phosphotransferase [Streptomyces sp. enrichment culture]|uniref:PPK2 family polyphosphate kinase n=1 Tax=Streptomyces sp. enrichment culture TaxID=1795815 RepID=UPI003F56BAA3